MKGNLPARLSSFVGRATELRYLDGMLERGDRLVTIVGPGGAGKTRIALRAAADRQRLYPAGAWWVDLSLLVSEELVDSALAATLGIRESSFLPIIDRVTESLADAHAIIVLDNCEHVAPAVSRLATRVVSACPRVTLLSTSREPISVEGESVWRLPLLSVPPVGEHRNPGDFDACMLFLQRARQTGAPFDPGPSEMDVIGEICRRLDGLPLAIELAAARVSILSPEQILSALDHRFALLATKVRDPSTRHESVFASITWSYSLLDDADRAAFRRASVFSGGFDLEAAASILASGNQGEALRLVERLVDRSLLQVTVSRGTARYFMLESLQQYAYDLLTGSGEAEEAHRAHLEFFVSLTERLAEDVEFGRAPSVERLRAEEANVRVALRHAISSETTDTDLPIRLANLMVFMWQYAGRFEEGQSTLSKLLERAADDKQRARMRWGLAHLCFHAGEIGGAIFNAQQAVSLAERCGRQDVLARALAILGAFTAFADRDEGRRMLTQSVALARSSGDEWGTIDALGKLAFTRVLRCERADEELREMRERAERAGSDCWTGWLGGAAGVQAFVSGAFQDGLRATTSALTVATSLGDPSSLGFCLAWHVALLAETGDPASAREALASVEENLRRSGGMGIGATIGYSRAVVARAEGDLEAFRAICAELLEDPFNQLPFLRVQLLCFLGEGDASAGDVRSARQRFEEAASLADLLESSLWKAVCDLGFARIAIATDDVAVAERHAHEALRAFESLNARRWVPAALELLAATASLTDRALPAARLFGASATAARTIGQVPFPDELPTQDALAARLIDRLGEQTFRQAFAEGEAMDIDGAIAYVRRARGARKRPATGWDSLTPVELEVVGLVAAGLSNPQIAERLFMSRDTVKKHLSRTFAKLAVTTRAEVAAEAAHRNL